MDIYVNTMLGLPRTISEDDFDQDMPLELDDENITVHGYRYDRQGDRLSSSGIANAHTKLIFIMKKIVTKLYPIKPLKVEEGTGRPGDLLAHDIVYRLELELQDWMNHLPLELKPGVEPPGQYLKANRLLHISYLHVKIILYRPFIHYISQDITSATNGNGAPPPTMNDLRGIEKAKNCINVARIVVKLAEDMIDKRMLSGSYWFSIYTIFFSVACLVYYVHFAPPVNSQGKVDPEYLDIKKDAEMGKKVLDVLKDSSMAAKRTYNILNALFEQLNRRTAKASTIGHDSHERENESGNAAGNGEQSEAGSGAGAGGSFVTPQMGKSLEHGSSSNSYNSPYGNLQQQQQQQQLQQQEKNHFSSGVNNGVNYIDGIATGINLSMPEIHSTSMGYDQSQSQNQSQQQQMQPQPQQQHLYQQQMQQQQQQFQQQQQQQQQQTQQQQQRLGNRYKPGPMDQLDMKIFGRFLPPYMLHQDSKNEINDSPQPPQPQQLHDQTMTTSSSHSSHYMSTPQPQPQPQPQQQQPQSQQQTPQQQQQQQQQPGSGSYNSGSQGQGQQRQHKRKPIPTPTATPAPTTGPVLSTPIIPTTIPISTIISTTIC
ncbi:unnamed protein product [Ambrosiozyma monospora]|uniref:Unnamed protein product n=1 Tax=Ambrosiozyma monospora TaxID=43982 RepID=A0ACB5TCN3_AMBMO|nr:unnamed protein product [Ambrosiozyma monospora]